MLAAVAAFRGDTAAARRLMGPAVAQFATRAPSTPPANSVAVLYFESRSGDPNDLAPASGLTEESVTAGNPARIIQSLSGYLETAIIAR